MDDDIDNMFDDHPSLSASLEDFAANSNARRSPLLDLPSQHSGFRSEESDNDMDDDPTEPWSPPGLRSHDYVPGSGWYRHQPYERKENQDRLELKPTSQHSPSRSREPSPQYEDAPEAPLPVGAGYNTANLPDITLAANTPLPPGTDSPLKGRSVSPDPPPKGGGGGGNNRREDNESTVESQPTNLNNCKPLSRLGKTILLTISPRHTFRLTRRSSASRTICRLLQLPAIQI